MRKISVILLALAIILCNALPAGATLFLDSWGVNPSTNTWAPASAPSHLYSNIENFTGSGPGFVDPGWGGRAFDAASAYVATDGLKIYIAVVTGLPQSGSKDTWRYNNPNYTAYDWNKSL